MKDQENGREPLIIQQMVKIIQRKTENICVHFSFYFIAAYTPLRNI